MKTLKSALLVAMLLSTVWGLYLTYKILELIQATELIWFLFWASIPIAFVLAVLRSLVED